MNRKKRVLFSSLFLGAISCLRFARDKPLPIAIEARVTRPDWSKLFEKQNEKITFSDRGRLNPGTMGAYIW